MEELVSIKENKLFTTSRKVSVKFNKEHSKVLRAIKNLEIEGGFNQANFGLVEYLDEKGEARPEYVMSRDGFALLVMGFTGKQALKFKIEYINAFNEAEEKLKKLSSVPVLSIEEIIMHQLQARIEDRKRIDTLENKVDLILKDREEAETELLLIERSTEKMPEESIRAKINRIVRQFSTAKNIEYRVLWNKVYDRLLYTYKIAIKKYKKLHDKETLLEVAERNGFIDKIYIIVSHEFTV